MSSISLTAEQINEFITNAVSESMIGEEVKNSVERVIAGLKKGYNNPFDAVIKKHIDVAISQVIQESFQEDIKNSVRESLSGKITDDLVSGIVDAAYRKLVQGYT